MRERDAGLGGVALEQPRLSPLERIRGCGPHQGLCGEKGVGGSGCAVMGLPGLLENMLPLSVRTASLLVLSCRCVC